MSETASERRFDGRVAIVTGAGRGLGRAYAELLAARGAKVVVNDLGARLDGDGPDAGAAHAVAEAIREAGGEAVASSDSVATAQGGAAIVQAAADAFGRVDILIHNAGNVRYGGLDEISHEDFRAVVDVHLHGAFNVVRPAFPLMRAAGYGRVVLTGSIGGLYGTHKVANYAMSKAGMIGLSNVVAIEGAEYGIKSNIILPGAVTRMADGLDMSSYPPMPPELVAPVVGWLAHESCSVTGEMFVSMAGRVARAYVAETQGIYRPDWTIDAVADSLDEIRSTNESWLLPPYPSAYVDHMRRSFDMVHGRQQGTG